MPKQQHRYGAAWNGHLEDWLAEVLSKDPDGRSQSTFESWAFPTPELRDEYLESIATRAEEDVRSLLRSFLFEATTFTSDVDAFRRQLSDPKRLEELGQRSEYYRRLPKGVMSRTVHAQPGVRWVLDLLPDAPRQAIAVIDAYARAHGMVLPDGRLNGLDDARAVIRARYIDQTPSDAGLAMMGISPREFEILVARLYSRLGFRVRVTQPRADGGRDVEAEADLVGRKQRLLIECKLYNGTVGVEVARSLLGMVAHERASGGVLVTSGRITRGVRDLASQSSQFDFIAGDALIKLLNEHLGSDWPRQINWLVGRGHGDIFFDDGA